ncbi:lub1 [Symbiodinium sp. KB8]|nr:lub1 [Symbiodinium sp. KB8]
MRLVGAIASSTSFIATASNDSVVKMWSFDGAQITALSGHQSFVYGVAFAGDSGEILSSSDDCTLKVWCDAQCKQSIVHAGTVWQATSLPNADIVTACADMCVRVWTRDPARMAPEAERTTQQEIAQQANVAAAQKGSSSVPMDSVIDIAKMPTMVGKKNGEIKMFNENGTVFAYMWNAGARIWDKVGEVMGSEQPKKHYDGDPVFPAGEYDFIFDVDLGASFGTKQLPFNRGQNPLVAAESFCSREQIHKGNAEQIRQFIIQNAGEEGASGGGSAPAAAPSAPEATPYPKETQAKLFPVVEPWLFQPLRYLVPKDTTYPKELLDVTADPCGGFLVGRVSELATDSGSSAGRGRCLIIFLPDRFARLPAHLVPFLMPCLQLARQVKGSTAGTGVGTPLAKGDYIAQFAQCPSQEELKKATEHVQCKAPGPDAWTAKERLFGRPVLERKPPPTALAAPPRRALLPLFEAVAAAGQDSVVIAADGSSQHGVGAYALICDEPVTKIASADESEVMQPAVFKDGKFDAIQGKILEFNSQVEESLKLDPVETAHFAEGVTKLKTGITTELRDCEKEIIIKKMGKWPNEKLFPVVDLWRLFLAHPNSSDLFKGSDRGTAYIMQVLGLLSSDINGPLGLCAARYLANLFIYQTNKYAAFDKREQVLKGIEAALGSTNKHTKLACTSVLLNMAIVLYESSQPPKALDEASALRVAQLALGFLDKASEEEDARHRAILAIGSILPRDKGAIVAECKAANFLGKVSSLEGKADLDLEAGICLQYRGPS